MKLILCPVCDDIVKLHRTMTECQCKKSWGWYKDDGWHAVIGGSSVAIGVDNHTLKHAIVNQPDSGEGLFFTAWVFPKDYERIERRERTLRSKRKA